jgi:hypothetical protein
MLVLQDKIMCGRQILLSQNIGVSHKKEIKDSRKAAKVLLYRILMPD